MGGKDVAFPFFLMGALGADRAYRGQTEHKMTMRVCAEGHCLVTSVSCLCEMREGRAGAPCGGRNGTLKAKSHHQVCGGEGQCAHWWGEVG